MTFGFCTIRPWPSIHIETERGRLSQIPFTDESPVLLPTVSTLPFDCALRSALAREALANLIPPARAALILREAANYLQDVVAFEGQDADAVRDAAGEALNRCESALRALANGTALGSGRDQPQPQQAQSSGGLFSSLGGPGGGGLGQANTLLGGILGQGFGGRR